MNAEGIEVVCGLIALIWLIVMSSRFITLCNDIGALRDRYAPKRGRQFVKQNVDRSNWTKEDLQRFSERQPSPSNTPMPNNER